MEEDIRKALRSIINRMKAMHTTPFLPSELVELAGGEEGKKRLAEQEETEQLFFSIQEGMLTNSPALNKDVQLMGFWLLESPENELLASEVAPFGFIAPESMRTNSKLTLQGRMVTKLSLFPYRAKGQHCLFSLYRVSKTSKSALIIDKISELVGTLDWKYNMSGSVHMLEAIGDRVELLTRLAETTPVLGTRIHLPEKTNNTCYYLYTPKGFERKGVKYTLQRKEDKLVFIDDQGTLATPLQDYLLFRIGPKEQEQNLLQYINELRRAYSIKSRIAQPNMSEHYSKIKEQERDKKNLDLAFSIFKDAPAFIPMVTPIAIEVAQDLVPYIAREDNSFTPKFQKLVNDMRGDIQDQLGFQEIPGVRVRGNEGNLVAGTYIIMVDEVPIVSGMVSLEEVFVDETVDTLYSFGIRGEETKHPEDGSDCSWVSKDDRKALEMAGFGMKDALTYVMYHLKVVLRNHFATFITIQATKDQLAQLSPQHLTQISDLSGGIPRFVLALKELADEKVSIKELEDIHDCYVECTRQNKPLYEINHELRKVSSVRSGIWINQLHRLNQWKEQSVYAISEEIQDILLDGLIMKGDTLLLALEPVDTQELLAAVRDEVSHFPAERPYPTIIVNDWKIRRPLRKLVELEFPNVHVMTEDEVLQQVQWKETISL